MKIIAFADLHESITAMRSIEKRIRQQKPDIAICAGDFTIFEQHIEYMMKWLASLPVPVFVVHGNHEEEAIVRKFCSFHGNIEFIHERLVKFKDYAILGFGGGGFSFTEPKFEKWAKKLPKMKNGIFVTHQPAFNTKLDVVAGRHVGNKSFRRFINKHQELLIHICGHLHETFSKKDKIGKVKIINPEPKGRIINV